MCVCGKLVGSPGLRLFCFSLLLYNIVYLHKSQVIYVNKYYVNKRISCLSKKPHVCTAKDNE